MKQWKYNTLLYNVVGPKPDFYPHYYTCTQVSNTTLKLLFLKLHVLCTVKQIPGEY